MGMAASQARFLGLTARLNNVEFEAQQIHQQRTSLSNKSASYYSDLLGLSVPVAPSVDAYTQTVYTFDDGALTNQITSMVANAGGMYTVSYLRSWDDDFAIVSAAPRIVTHTTEGTTPPNNYYRIGSQLIRELDQWSFPGPTTTDKVYFEGADGYQKFLKNGKFYSTAACTPPAYSGNVTVDRTTPGNTTGVFTEGYFADMTAEQFRKLSEMENKYKQLVHDETGSTGNVFVRYIENTTTGEFEPVFMNQADLEGATYDSNGNSISNINAYKIGTKQRNEEIIGVQNCRFEQDSTGRYINITIPVTGGGDVTYSLTTNTITDQDAYEDAMNQYEYDKATYDQSIADINAKIEIVQAEDKNLELRLKQLDTEHNAIQTERDQVKELIKKNVDSSFKTFG